MFDRRLISNFDWFLLAMVLTLSLVGVLAIKSASQGYSDDVQYWSRQLSWIGIGLLAGFVVLLVDFRTIGRWSYIIHGAVVLSLAGLVFLGRDTVGVNRWLSLGPVAIQPSEFAKITSVLAIAYYFRDSRRGGRLGLRSILVPAGLVLAPFALIVQQPDLGTAMLLLLSAFPIVVLAGIRTRILVSLAVIGIMAVTGLVISFQMGTYRIDGRLASYLERQGAGAGLVAEVRTAEGREYASRGALRRAFFDEREEPGTPLLDAIAQESFHPYISRVLRDYQQKRLLTFLDPNQDPLGAGYHIIQSKVAIGSGGFWGKGYGESTQGSLNFLPARHTDFLFSIFAEEWGFLGVMAILGLYGTLIARGLNVVLQTRDRYSAFLIMGVISIITVQVLINAGMVVGLLPVVGVPMPFFSYGGSSMVTLMIGVGFILNIRMRRFLWN